jgi:hypothetical protein
MTFAQYNNRPGTVDAIRRQHSLTRFARAAFQRALPFARAGVFRSNVKPSFVVGRTGREHFAGCIYHPQALFDPPDLLL